MLPKFGESLDHLTDESQHKLYYDNPSSIFTQIKGVVFILRKIIVYAERLS